MRKTIDAVAAAGVLAALIGALLVWAGPAAAEAKREQQGVRVAAQLIARGAGYGEPQGSQRVRALQRRLRRAGERPGAIDGRFGPLTETAVRSFQRRQGLAVDGIVGPLTTAAVRRAAALIAPGAGYGLPRGSQRVRALQRRLRRAGERPGAIDGRFGRLTEAAVVRFQRRQGLAVDGLVSERTGAALARRVAALARTASERRRARAGQPALQTPATKQKRKQTKQPEPTPAGNSQSAASPGYSAPEPPGRKLVLALVAMLSVVLAGAVLARGRPAKRRQAAAAVDHDVREIWLRADPASASVARAFVARAAAELHYDREASGALRLGITEAVANAVEHGAPCNNGLISVSVYLEAGCLMTEVGDCGDFRAARQRTNGLDEGGRGLLLMFAVMDHVEINTVPGRTVVRLAKRLPGSAGELELLNIGERPARERETPP